MSLKILVVDDEPQIRKQIKIAFEGLGHQIFTASNGLEAITVTAQEVPDIIVLDISLGCEPDGLETCVRLREWSNTPIIMLSVHDEEKTKITALQNGADDYMTKPFSPQELYARILAIRRRQMAEPGISAKTEIRAGSLLIDLVHRKVFVDQDEVHLTPKEYELLRLLAVHSGKVLTHRAILNTVWGPEYSDIQYVRVFVNQIRKKLRENPVRNIRYILSEPSIGYRFVNPG